MCTKQTSTQAKPCFSPESVLNSCSSSTPLLPKAQDCYRRLHVLKCSGKKDQAQEIPSHIHKKMYRFVHMRENRAHLFSSSTEVRPGNLASQTRAASSDLRSVSLFMRSSPHGAAPSAQLHGDSNPALRPPPGHLVIQKHNHALMFSSSQRGV